MPDIERIGFGTTFAYSTDDGATYIPLARINGFTPAKLSVGDVSIDGFDNDTYNGLPVEKTIPGWVKPGEYGVKLWYLKTQFATLRSMLGTRDMKFQVVKPDGSGYDLVGYVKEVGEEIPLKEGMTCEIMVMLTQVADFEVFADYLD